MHHVPDDYLIITLTYNLFQRMLYNYIYVMCPSSWINIMLFAVW